MTLSTATNPMFITSSDAARLLSVSQLTIQRWAAARMFPVFRYMKHLRFRRSDLIRFAENRMRPAADSDCYGRPHD